MNIFEVFAKANEKRLEAEASRRDLSAADLCIIRKPLSTQFVVLDSNFEKVELRTFESLRLACRVVLAEYGDTHTVIPLRAYHDIYCHR